MLVKRTLSRLCGPSGQNYVGAFGSQRWRRPLIARGCPARVSTLAVRRTPISKDALLAFYAGFWPSSGALLFRRIVARPSTPSVWSSPDVASDTRRGPPALSTLTRGARRSRTSKNASIPSIPGEHDMVDVHWTHCASRTLEPPLTSTKATLAAGLCDKTPLDYAQNEALLTRVVACGTSHAAEAVREVRRSLLFGSPA